MPVPFQRSWSARSARMRQIRVQVTRAPRETWASLSLLEVNEPLGYRKTEEKSLIFLLAVFMLV